MCEPHVKTVLPNYYIQGSKVNIPQHTKHFIVEHNKYQYDNLTYEKQYINNFFIIIPCINTI